VNGARVGVDQQLGRVEAQTELGTVIGAGEEADFDRGGVLGEEREIDTRPIPMSTKGVRRADPRSQASRRVFGSRRGVWCQDTHAAASPIQSMRTNAYGGERCAQGDRY
jgi:hypothetical protein